MRREATPLLLGELHARPVVVARGVLFAELHAEGLRRRAFGRGDVRLELDCIRTGIRDRVDERMRKTQAAVVRQRDFADDQASTMPHAVNRRIFAHDVCGRRPDAWTLNLAGFQYIRSINGKRPASTSAYTSGRRTNK